MYAYVSPQSVRSSDGLQFLSVKKHQCSPYMIV